MKPDMDTKTNQSPAGAHKVVWSVPANTYTLAAVCEYCGAVFFHSDAGAVGRAKMAKNVGTCCPNNPHEGAIEP